MAKIGFLRSLLLLTTFTLFFLFTSFSDGKVGSGRDNTPGTVTFTVKTLTANGQYAPKHVLAIWVEKDGEFVKTRKAMANQRKQYLYTWRASSNYNVIDAITGPTLTSHQTHTIEWDCTDVDGNIVPDGDYTMLIEFTDKHAQGPLYSIDFTKGTEPVSITPPNQTYFTNMQLTYEPDIAAIAEFGASETEACIDQNIVFTDNSSGATSWSWDFGAGAVPATANTQGPHTVHYATSGAKTVALTINGSVTVTKTDYITIFPEPTAGFTSSVNNLTVSFTNYSQNASGYLWDFGDGNTSTETNPVHTFADYGTYQIILTATSQMCGDDVYSETLELTQIAVAEFGADITQACPLQNIIFTDNSTAASSWEWSFGNGAVPSTANTQGPHNVHYTTAGAKTVVLTINGSVTVTKTDYITIFPEPTAGFTFNIVSKTVSFSNTSLNAVTYAWDFGDGGTSTEVSPVHIYAEDGEYEVSLTANSALCGNDIHTEIVVINTVGVAETTAEMVYVYPNPSSGKFFIAINNRMSNLKIRMYDVKGRLIFSHQAKTTDAGFLFSTENNPFAPGLYFIDVTSDETVFRKKLIVQ